MAMFTNNPTRPENYERFERETPRWFSDAKLGIFVHWGPYSVPAWAEPVGPLGGVDKEYWYAHNPYAEWYYNTIRIEGSPAHQLQQERFGGADYDDFLDAWKAEKFDADAVLDVVRRSGARYFVPTTKHHDGVTLWDAPATDGRNTVKRGPERDLVREFEAATRNAGLRFGVYYSGGLDWHFAPDLPPITSDFEDVRPVDAAYAEYAYDHVADLIERYKPDVLWGDIEWPDAGKESGPFSMENLFEKFYAAAPDGVSNDRWGMTHWDFRTSEYEHGREVEAGGAWENCRGIGFSFGHNTQEDDTHLLSGPAAARMFTDIVSRGGNFLLNIGLTASGEIPAEQEATLLHLGAWNELNGHAIFASRPYPAGAPSDAPWLRWTQTEDAVHAFFEGPGDVRIADFPAELDLESARAADGTAVAVATEADGVVVTVPAASVEGPVLVTFTRAS